MLILQTSAYTIEALPLEDDIAIDRVADMAWQDADRKAPAHYFTEASPLPSWKNETVRSVLDGIALGMFVTATGGQRSSEPSGAVLARRLPGSGQDHVLIYAGSHFDPDGTLAALIDAARKAADAKGCRLVNRIVIPERVEFVPA